MIPIHLKDIHVSTKASKYRNHREIGGYQSRKEARRAAELKLMEKAGKIRNLREQVPFLLIPAQKDPHTLEHLERACTYFCDFVYEEPIRIDSGLTEWLPVHEDVKGMRTKDYVIKRKLMLQVHKIRIREI